MVLESLFFWFFAFYRVFFAFAAGLLCFFCFFCFLPSVFCFLGWCFPGASLVVLPWCFPGASLGPLWAFLPLSLPLSLPLLLPLSLHFGFGLLLKGPKKKKAKMRVTPAFLFLRFSQNCRPTCAFWTEKSRSWWGGRPYIYIQGPSFK